LDNCDKNFKFKGENVEAVERYLEGRKNSLMEGIKIRSTEFYTILDLFGRDRKSRDMIDRFNELLEKYNLDTDKKIDMEISNDVSIKFKLKTNSYSGLIKVSPDSLPKQLYRHQREAIGAMTKTINNKDDYRGLLVLPTGGGKTFTAIYWLLQNIIDKGHKVLWIAHRIELLDQAFESLKSSAYSNIIANKKDFRYRVISGDKKHDIPSNIEKSDDFIIASKDSINSEYLQDKWLAKNKDKTILLVIDEAHHATAQTYRNVIKILDKYTSNVKVLGLTATPFRTAESEKGLLKKVFPDDIVYKQDLKSLITEGILSTPIFEEVKTNFELSDEDIESVQAQIESKKFMDKLPEKLINQFISNSERNKLIINQYSNYQEKYGQTLVFALNINDAIGLNKLFQAAGIKSQAIHSGLTTQTTRINISNEERKKHIEAYRNGELQVLVNVDILTEGTDLPSTKSIFVVRPTTSEILMTQMIGRALRGEKAGGTSESYIVNFVDNWKDKIRWVNPQKLYIDDDSDFSDNSPEAKKRQYGLISVKLIEDLAMLLNNGNSNDTAIDFDSVVPVGFYLFAIDDDNSDEKSNYEIIVYQTLQEAYETYIDDLENAIDLEADKIEEKYFDYYDLSFGYDVRDIKAIQEYYSQTKEKPTFYTLHERNKTLGEIDGIVNELLEIVLTEKGKHEFLTAKWDNNELFRALFHNNFRNFRDVIQREINAKLDHSTAPKTQEDISNKEKLNLNQLKEKYPKYYQELVDSVYKKGQNKDDGLYQCAKSGYRSKQKFQFEIDHIIPMSKGGLSKTDNLQLLKRSENRKKRDIIE